MPKPFLQYKPYPHQLPVERIRQVRERLRRYIKVQYYDLDTAPRSPFGDLFVTPAAIQETATEMAVENILHDLNLENLMRGDIRDPVMAQQMLKFLGVEENPEQPAYALVQIIFSEPVPLYSDGPWVFRSGGSWESRSVYQGTQGTIAVLPAALNKPAGFYYEQIGMGSFQITVPVVTTEIGRPPNAYLTCPQLEGIPHLTSIQLLTLPFRVAMGTSIPDRLRRAKLRAQAPGFDTVGSLESYIRSAYPAVTHIFMATPESKELTRRGNSLLGIPRPSVDVYVRNDKGLQYREDRVLMRYNEQDSVWTAGYRPVTGMALFDHHSVATTNTFSTTSPAVQVISKSGDPQLLPSQVAGSVTEHFSLQVRGLANAVVSPQSAQSVDVVSDNTTYRVDFSGSYYGDPFSTEAQRSLEMEATHFNMLKVAGINRFVVYFKVRDTVTGESGNIGLTATTEDTSTPRNLALSARTAKALGPEQEALYRKFFNGLDITIYRIDGDGPQETVTSTITGVKVTVVVKARSCWMRLGYWYDPAVYMLNAKKAELSFTGLTDMLVKPFYVSAVTRLQIEGSYTSTTPPDATAIKDRLVRYINHTQHPDQLHISEIHRLLHGFGVSRITGCAPTIVHHSSAADTFYSNGVSTPAGRTISYELEDIPSMAGHSLRNHMYFITPDAIHLQLKRAS